MYVDFLSVAYFAFMTFFITHKPNSFKHHNVIIYLHYIIVIMLIELKYRISQIDFQTLKTAEVLKSTRLKYPYIVY